MVPTEAVMSEWKRSHQEYATPAAPLNPVARGPVRPVAVRSELGIDERGVVDEALET